MKKILITVLLVATTSFAFPVTDLGSSSFYVEVEDTVLTIDCPAEGIIMVGYTLSTTASLYCGLVYIDGQLISANRGCDYQEDRIASGTNIYPVSAGNHVIKAVNDYHLPSDETRTWAIFWAYDTGGAVAEQPKIEPDDLVNSEIHKVGDRISFEHTKTSIYDSAGRLVGRMGPGNWIPTATGTYFIAYVRDDEVELKKIVVTN